MKQRVYTLWCNSFDAMTTRKIRSGTSSAMPREYRIACAECGIVAQPKYRYIHTSLAKRKMSKFHSRGPTGTKHANFRS